jgi:hypothetical protein
MASERSWLLNPGPLKLFNQCRRLIQSEFGVKLRTTDDELEHRLAEYAGKTRSSQLAKIWESLKPQIPTLEMPAEEGGEDNRSPDRPKRMYRGQVIADEPTTKTNAQETSPESDQPGPRKSKVIYRGQVVG